MKLRALLVVTFPLVVIASCDQERITGPELSSSPEILAKITRHDQYSFDFAQWNECTGEVMRAAGTMHVVMHTSGNSRAGPRTYKSHYNLQDATAVGETSGMICQVVMAANHGAHYWTGYPPYSHTDVHRFRWICPGPDNDVIMHQQFHMTVDANGQITVEFGRISEECTPDT